MVVIVPEAAGMVLSLRRLLEMSTVQPRAIEQQVPASKLECQSAHLLSASQVELEAEVFVIDQQLTVQAAAAVVSIAVLPRAGPSAVVAQRLKSPP